MYTHTCCAHISHAHILVSVHVQFFCVSAGPPRRERVFEEEVEDEDEEEEVEDEDEEEEVEDILQERVRRSPVMSALIPFRL